MKNLSNKTLSLFLSLSLVLLSSFGMLMPRLAMATALTSVKDTMTRVKISANADHTVTFTMPTGIAFDSAGNTDMFKIDFPTSSAFTTSGTWATADFTFTDSVGSRTIQSVSAGGGTVDCTVSTAQNVCIAVDTTAMAFYVKPASTYTATSTGSAVTLTIDGTATDGELINPSSAASYAVDVAMCDETASCNTSFTSSHVSQLAVGIADDDQVTVTATVTSSLTFDLDTASNFGNGESATPYSVAFGTLSTSDVKSSGTTDSVQMIVAEADTNATGGVIVTVLNANGTSGLKSTSTPADTIPSADGVMATTTANYGLCVATSGLSGFSRASPYDTGTCAVDGETNQVYNLTTTGENILSTSGPVASAHAEIVANAAITGVTVAHSDYTDTLTFVATATF